MLCFRSDAFGPRSEDYCLANVFGSGTLGVIAVRLVEGNNFASLCEAEVSPSCPFGWTVYVDDGSEGADSCVMISTGTVSTWAAANASCPAGSHLLTVRSASTAAGLLPFATSLYRGAGQLVYVGCFQDAAALSRASGWAWIDGTDASNLNCGTGSGGDGCGLWNASQPRY